MIIYLKSDISYTKSKIVQKIIRDTIEHSIVLIVLYNSSLTGVLAII